MAEPAHKLPIPPDEDDNPEFPVLQRWIEHPDGRLELLERPLTPEDFLNPQPEDTMSQGEAHATARRQLADLLDRHFKPAALVLEDVIHQLGPGLPAPSPDVSVILGARPGHRDSFSVPEEGCRPDLIVEIVSPSRKSIRRVDEVDKVEAYGRAGIPEYVLIDLPRRGNQYRLGLKGYRLNPEGRYSPIELDARGHLPCRATRLRFFIEGDRVRVIDDRTGQPLLYSDEEEARRKSAEAARNAAEDARKAAEDENARLQEELERLKSRLSS
jgi:Uma2 family endonuclease